MKDIKNQKFGRLTPVCVDESANKRRRAWKCRCDCGNSVSVVTCKLISGHTKSCGCLHRETKNRLTHGMSHTREHYTWGGMIQRCYNPNSDSFPYYGGRGIKVCEKWRNSFEEFFKDMGIKPPKMTIERIENSGDYEPGNCRWATHKEQMANQRKRIVSTVETIDGFTGNIGEMARHFDISYSLLRRTMKRIAGTCGEAVVLVQRARLRGRKKIKGYRGSELPNWLKEGFVESPSRRARFT
jgi:hypothetical protein